MAGKEIKKFKFEEDHRKRKEDMQKRTKIDSSNAAATNIPAETDFIRREAPAVRNKRIIMRIWLKKSYWKILQERDVGKAQI